MLAGIKASLATHGLVVHGGFDPAGAEASPPGPSGAPARSVLLIGNAGAGYWRQFARWRDGQPPDLPHPLDTWSRAVIGAVADAVGARLVMPNDRPFAPFQQWAMRATGMRPSPLGLLIHPEYGLWHAFRGALLFDRPLALPTAPAMPHPCDSCRDRPCLDACPVDAFAGDGFAHAACIAHVRGPRGSACRDLGCLARNACPVGARWRYPAAVQAFHQRAFAGLASPTPPVR